MIRRLLPVLALMLPSAALADPTILAAASTGRALDAALAESGIAGVTSYAASGVLARQIEQGAPADLFISANPKWMTYLVDAGIVAEDQVSVLMSNSLVLIAPEGSAPLAPEQIAERLAGENFVMADPASAPVGAYGKAALETLEMWDTVSPHLVPMRNTVAAVAAVARGEAELGLVYASDASGVPGITVVWTVPQDSHPKIRYLIAPVVQGDDPDGAANLLAYLQSPAGRAVLAQYGFLALGGGS